MPRGIFIRIRSNKNKGKKNSNMARKGKANGMFGTKGWFAWRDISGFDGTGFKGKHHTEEAKKIISKKNTTNSRNYWTLHKWLHRNKGKAFGCIDCRLNDLKGNYEWSNVSREYLRDLNDWVSRCIPCHRKYDGNDKLYLHSPLYKKYTNLNERN